ncbi:MAG: A/G-specific adenine glycosylase [Bacillariaceae sp.]|jgi:A/G-specific adenine glycosylase
MSNNELQLQLEVQEPDDVNSSLLFQTWIDHSHADYHNFTEKDAIEIRSALLEWYTKNRRKLPWRGDPPPFDGSTSGINNNNNSNSNRSKKNANKKIIDNKNQKSITSFFDKPKNSNSTTKTNKNKNKNKKQEEMVVEQQNIIDQEIEEEEEVDVGEAIPITAYGVWVSEIMCQQTRVEAVIPYWIKCEF